MPKKIKGFSLCNIPKYLIRILTTFIPHERLANLVKFNKKLQNKIDISLYTYQKLFLQNKILIDYKDISFIKLKKFKPPSSWGKNREILPPTKIEIPKFIEFLNNEFDVFTKENERKIVEKIIKEILKEKELYKIEKQIFTKNQIKFIPIEDKIKWRNDSNIVELNLHNVDLEEENFFNYEKKKKNKIIIPSGLFPNLKSLKMGFNCIVPASLIAQLDQLYIKVIPNEILLFKNDTDQDEIKLDNLKILSIIREDGYNDDPFLEEQSFTDQEQLEENLFSDEEEEEEKEEKEEEEKEEEEKEEKEEEEKEEEEHKDKNKKKEKKKEIKKYLKNENKIKFICNNLEKLEIKIREGEDYSYLPNYFNFDFLYDALKDIRHSFNYIYTFLRGKFLNYKPSESLKYFRFCLISDGNEDMYTFFFKIKKFKNELKRYTFKIFGYSQNSIWASMKENLEENIKNQIILKKYQNFSGIKDFDNILMDQLNVLKLKDKQSKYRKLDKDKIYNLLHINKDNYSIQEICLYIKAFNDNLIEKISYFKTLEKIVLENCITDKKIFLKFIEDLSKLTLLKVVYLKFKGNLIQKEKKVIKDFLPYITIEENKIEHKDNKKNKKEKIYVIKKYESYDTNSEFFF